MAYTPQDIAAAYRQAVGSGPGQMTEAEFVQRAMGEYGVTPDQLMAARNIVLGGAPAPAPIAAPAPAPAPAPALAPAPAGITTLTPPQPTITADQIATAYANTVGQGTLSAEQFANVMQSQYGADPTLVQQVISGSAAATRTIPNIDPRQLANPEYINYLKGQGYTDSDIAAGIERARQYYPTSAFPRTATPTPAPAPAPSANPTLPSNWLDYSEEQKIRWLNKNNVSADQMRQLGFPDTDNNYIESQRNEGIYASTLDPSQSTLSPNFADYVYNMLAKGEQAANLPFQEYTGERFAGPSDLQTRAFELYKNLDFLPQFEEATGIARLAAKSAQELGYTPGTFSAQQVTPEVLQRYQMTQPRDVTAERVSAPSLRDLRMDAARPIGAERVSTQAIPAAQTEYRPDLQAFQMQTPEERVTAESFAQPGTAEALMSPYMQGVIDKQTREAIRQADIARGGRGARYAQAGAFGGSRQAIEEAEAERNLQTQLGDITATGLQSAYQQAQEQFNREQQARQAAQQANIGTGLTVGQQNLAAQLGVQQLGTQTGLQAALANLTNEQQARVQSEANRLQAQGMNQQQALQAALANQQTQQQANLQNLSAALQTQGLQAQTGLESQRLNQATGLQALLANQQMGYNVGAQNLAANLGVQQLGAQQGLAAQQANQQYGLEAQRLGEQSRQFGAGYGIQGIGQQLQAGQLMSGIGTQQGQYGLQGLQGLLTAGGTQQQLAQQPYDFGYQQWQQSQQYPFQQATYMQSLLGGLPLQAASYDSGTSAFGNALAAAATGLGLYDLWNKGTAPTTGTKPGGQ